MKLFSIGKLGRFCDEPKGDPLGRFYDGGTNLRVSLESWLVFGLRVHRYGVMLFVGPILVMFYSRRPAPGAYTYDVEILGLDA